MTKKKQVTVNLFGAQGSRTVDLTSSGGFPTRHVKVPREVTPSIFEPIPEPIPDTPDTPTLDDLFAESLPRFIEGSRWGRYIVPGPASRIHDNTIFVYYDPCHNFWDLYEMSKGIFRDLGIQLKKEGAVWIARIPIRVLTDKVFIASGLAAVENTLLEHTGIDPSSILAGIRQRQFQETKDGMKRCKQLRETVSDAVGVLAIAAVSWAAYVVMGV